MLAEHPAAYVVDRFTMEGIPRPRAEWLVWRARQDRRRGFVIHKPPEQLDWDSRGVVPEELQVAPPRSGRIAKNFMMPFIALMIAGVTAMLVGAYPVVSIDQLRELPPLHL